MSWSQPQIWYVPIYGDKPKSKLVGNRTNQTKRKQGVTYLGWEEGQSDLEKYS